MTETAKTTDAFRKVLGAKQVIYLENLFGERNGHVDMFATFTAVDTIVIGEFPSAGGTPGTANIATWDGQNWGSVGGGLY